MAPVSTRAFTAAALPVEEILITASILTRPISVAPTMTLFRGII